jgi:hypothetical protein
LLTDVEKPPLDVGALQNIDIPKDKWPKLGGPMICPFCRCRYIIYNELNTKIHTNNGWIFLKKGDNGHEV